MTRLRERARATLRKGALDALSMTYQIRDLYTEAFATPRVHLPYLHAIPHQAENTFRSFVEELAKYHTFISYTEAVTRIQNGAIDKPYISFSFDDGFQSNVRAAHILEEFGATGMFFVPAKFIGTPTVEAARDFYGFSEGVDEPAMTWGDLDHLLDRGHEIGNHTLNHKVMSWVGPDEMRKEIIDGAELLRSRLGSVDHFAWPRGRFFHFTQAAARTVFEAGHKSCSSAERGAHTHVHNGPADSLCLRRDHIMAEWPLRHSLYFVAKSSRRSGTNSNEWPQGWRVP